jgi:hypothetical protein
MFIFHVIIFTNIMKFCTRYISTTHLNVEGQRIIPCNRRWNKAKWQTQVPSGECSCRWAKPAAPQGPCSPLWRSQRRCRQNSPGTPNRDRTKIYHNTHFIRTRASKLYSHYHIVKITKHLKSKSLQRFQLHARSLDLKPEGLHFMCCCGISRIAFCY